MHRWCAFSSVSGFPRSGEFRITTAKRSTTPLRRPESARSGRRDPIGIGWRLLFSLRQRLGDLAGGLDEKLRDWAERAVLQRDDTDRRAADLPLKADGTADENSSLLEDDADTGSALEPGETRLLAANLEPGHYVLVCNLPPNHYKAGMRLDITVK